MKEVDLPGAASQIEGEILDSAVAALAGKFPTMFKETPKCKRPHLNVDNLRDALFQTKVKVRPRSADSRRRWQPPPRPSPPHLRDVTSNFL